MPGVKYIGPILDASGYSEAARNYVLSIHKKGYPITVAPITFEKTRPDLGEQGRILNSLINKRIEYDKVIVHSTPDLWQNFTRFESNKYLIGYTVWETSGLHPTWAMAANRADEIWIPCDWNVEVFKGSGVTKPLFKVPHAIDVPEMGSIPDFNLEGLSDNDFVFCSIFQWQERKNPYGLLAAYSVAFTGVQDVALVLKTYRFDHAGDREQIKNMVLDFRKHVTLDHFPKIFLVVENLSKQEILGLHKRSDAFVLLQRSEGWGLCVASDTKILTSQGVAHVKELPDSSLVMNKAGRFTKVVAKKGRYVSEALRIHSKSWKADPLVVSKEHPVYSVGATKPDGTKIRFSLLDPESLEKDLSWRPSESLNVGDFVATPRPLLDMPLPETLDLIELIPRQFFTYDSERVFSKNGFSSKTRGTFSYKEMSSALGLDKWAVESAVRHIKSGTVPKESTKTAAAYNHLTSVGFHPAQRTSISRFVHLNAGVLSLFGWYLAEGSWGSNAIDISLSSKEVAVAEMLKKTFMENFGVPAYSINYYCVANKLKFRVSSVLIAELFRALFGHGAAEKYVPDFLFSSGKHLQPLVSGLFGGDGYDSGGYSELTTLSPNLAYQMKFILMSQGVFPSMYRDKRNNCYRVRIQGAQYCTQNGTRPAKRTCNHFIETPNFFLVRVSEIERVKYDDIMFDIQVEEEESFIGNGLLLHNCHFEAAVCGKPVITPGYGGQTEFLNKDNSYLVDYNLTPVIGMRGFSPYYLSTQYWCEPNMQHAVETLQYVYSHREEAKEKGEQARQFIVDNFTWDKVGGIIVDRLNQLDGRTV